MKTEKILLVDACNTTLLYVDKDKGITLSNLIQNTELLEVVDLLPLRKIVVTNANPQIIKEALKWFDFEVFSLQNNPSKIEVDFYKQFLEHYSLSAEQCYYFDSKQDNLDVAKQLGIHGVLYKDNNQIIPYLQSLDLT